MKTENASIVKRTYLLWEGSEIRKKNTRSVITLLTDFGTKDSYVGIMKGVISTVNPDANVIDLSHEVGSQDVFEGTYTLYTSYKFFPEGTVHVAVVDPGVGSGRKIICVKTANYIFLAPDNGILGFVLANEKPQFIVEVTNKEYFLPEVSDTFHGRDIFAPVAAHLSRGVNPLRLGKKLKKMQAIELPAPDCSIQGVIRGEVIYIDTFGNLITNISQDVFNKTTKKVTGARRSGTCDTTVKAGRKKIGNIMRSYADVRVGKPLAIFGSTGFLEISVNCGSAHEALALKKGGVVTVCYNN